MLAAAHLVTNHDDLWAAVIAGLVAILIAVLRGKQINRKLGEPNGSGSIASMIQVVDGRLLAVHDEARAARTEAEAARQEALAAVEVTTTEMREHKETDERRFDEQHEDTNTLRVDMQREIGAVRDEMRAGFENLSASIATLSAPAPRRAPKTGGSK